MAIQLEKDVLVGAPVLRRKEIGEKFRGVLVDIETRTSRPDKDGKQRLNRKGEPAQQLVLHLIAIKSTMRTGIDDPTAPNPGDYVRLIEQGGGFAAWIEAKRALGRGANVGDIVEVGVDRAVLYDMSGTALRETTNQEDINQHRLAGKSGQWGMRGPMVVRGARPEESEWVAKAESAYMVRKSRTATPLDGGEPSRTTHTDDDF